MVWGIQNIKVYLRIKQPHNKIQGKQRGILACEYDGHICPGTLLHANDREPQCLTTHSQTPTL